MQRLRRVAETGDGDACVSHCGEQRWTGGSPGGARSALDETIVDLSDDSAEDVAEYEGVDEADERAEPADTVAGKEGAEHAEMLPDALSPLRDQEDRGGEQPAAKQETE